MDSRTVRIFISSPNDVVEEREKALQVVSDLSRRYAGRLNLVPVLWENLPLMADASFQEGIETVLDLHSGIDVAVFILWTRLGSPLGKTILKPDGTQYRSGTEREWYLMRAARTESMKVHSLKDARPKLLAYVRDDELGFTKSLQGKSGDSVTESVMQRDFARQFVREQFHDLETGANVGAYTVFGEPVTFAHRLRTHLRELLDGMLPDTTTSLWEYPPYQGLESFDVEHAAIFRGREREVCEIDERLRARAKACCPFVILVGASGSGKSSLARAGWLHYLLHENLDVSVQRWLPVIFTPGEAKDGNLIELVVSKLAMTLPELRCEEGLAPLERALRESPLQAWELSIARAVHEGQKQARSRLVFLVDQLEELFTDSAITPAETDRFLQALRTLVRTGEVWCLATVRSDFFDRCLRSSTLMELIGSDGQLNVLAPNVGALHRIITLPAAMAGLRFESAPSGETLDARILAETANHPESLPLLEYLLRELYEGRSADGCLTFAKYDELGGVEGALRSRAETVFRGFAKGDARRIGALPELLNALVTMSDGEDAVPVRRRASLNELPEGPCRELAHVLIEERLLVSDHGQISVAHEALLRRWERAAEWISENCDSLRIRARLALAADRWRAEGEDDELLLPAGRPLAEAVALSTTKPQMLSDLLREYVSRSRERQSAAERRKRVRLQGTAAVFAVVALIAIIAAIKSWDEANKSLRLAGEKETLATKSLLLADEKDKLARKESSARVKADQEALRSATALYGTNLSLVQQKIRDGDTHAALRVLSQSRWDARGWEHDYLWTVAHRLSRLIAVHNTASSMAVTPDGLFLATAGTSGEVGKVVLWELASGRETAAIEATEKIEWIAFNHDGSRLAAAAGNSVIVWDPLTQKVLFELKGHTDTVTFVTFSADGKQLASAGRDDSVRVWDVAGANQSKALAIEYPTFLAFSPDGKNLACGTGVPANTNIRLPGDVEVWDLEATKQLLTYRHSNFVTSVAYSPDGRLIASGGGDSTVRIWEAVSGRDVLTVPGGGIGLGILAFSPDGRYLTVRSRDNKFKTHDLITGKEVSAFHTVGSDFHRAQIVYTPDSQGFLTLNENGEVRLWMSDTDTGATNAMSLVRNGYAVAFSPDGNQLASSDRAHYQAPPVLRVWDRTTGSLLFQNTDHDLPVFGLAYSADGQRLVSASNDGTAMVWDTKTWKRLHILDHLGINRVDDKGNRYDGIQDVAYTPDGRVVTAGGDNLIKVWNPENGELLATLSGVRDKIECMALSSDGRWLAAGGYGASVVIWDMNKQKVSHSIEAETGDRFPFVFAVAFSPNSEMVATAGDNYVVRLWDRGSGRAIRELRGHTGRIQCLLFSPDGKRLLSGGIDQTVRVWDVQTGLQVLAMPLPGEDNHLNHLAFSRDGRSLAAASGGGVNLWEANRWESSFTLFAEQGQIHAAAFDSKGDRVVAGSGVWDSEQEKHTAGAAYVWDAITGDTAMKLPNLPNDVTCVTFSPDDARVATGGRDKQVHIWDTQTGQEILVLRGHEDQVRGVAFSPDGRRIATASADRTVRVWNAEHGGQEFLLKGHQKRVYNVTFSPDGARLASCGGQYDQEKNAFLGGEIRIWDLGSRASVLAWERSSGGAWAVAFDHAGGRIASAHGDGVVCLWDANTGKGLKESQCHAGEVTCVNWSSDDRYLASGSTDGSVNIREPMTGRDLIRPLTHKGGVYGVAFSHDGKRLVAGVTNGTVVIHELNRLARADTVDDEARQLVTTLLSIPRLKGQLTDSIRRHTAIDPPTRERALQLAEVYAADPEWLANACIRRVVYRGGTPEWYRRALDWAKAAVAMNEENGEYHMALGAALFRTGADAESVEALTRADKIHSAYIPDGYPIDLAFLVMAQQRLGLKDEAAKASSRLDRSRSDPRWEEDTNIQLLRREIDALPLK